jgi:hypothetical protein
MHEFHQLDRAYDAAEPLCVQQWLQHRARIYIPTTLSLWWSAPSAPSGHSACGVKSPPASIY